MTDRKEGLGIDFHLFTSSSDFLKQLNLTNFTTGTLYDFWHTKGPKGDYPLRDLFLTPFGTRRDRGNFGPNIDPHPIFAFRDATESTTDFFGSNTVQMEAWRFEDQNKGSFVVIDGAHRWEWSDLREEIPWGPFEYNDLKISDFDGFRVEAAAEEGEDPQLVLHDEFGPDTIPQAHTVKFILNVVAMNDWVRLKEISKPKIQDWPDVDLARREFIDDIKTSRSGCLSIPVALHADLTPHSGEPCHKVENTTINLYLRDTLNDSEKKAFFALPELKKVGIRSDSTGRPYGSKKDGDLSSPDETNEGQKVAAEVAMHYNEYTHSWQSGSKTIIAKVTKKIGTANGAEDIDALAASVTADSLAGMDENYLQMGTGEAMPITMQNGNPYQWTPNYAQPAHCRGADISKAHVMVYNPDPDKSFEVGKTVLLHEVDGVWMPVEFGSGVPDEVTHEAIFKGRWEIQQFITNAGNFFGFPILQDIKLSNGKPNPFYPYGVGNKGAQVSPINAEKLFHRKFYFNDDYNNGSDKDILKYAGPDGVGFPNNMALEHKEEGSHSYFRQVTAFDYLEGQLGGTRGAKRSILRTKFGEWANGDLIEDGGASPDNTLYFGALFPDGWTATDMDDHNESGPQTLAQENRGWVGKAYGIAKTYWPNEGTYDEVLGGGFLLPKNTGEDDARNAHYEGGKQFIEGDEEFGINTGPVIALFNKFAVDGITDLTHMPADYALNASPSGNYGRPLMNMRAWSYFDNEVDLATLGTEQYNKWKEMFKNHCTAAIAHGRGMDEADIGTAHPLNEREFPGFLWNWLYREPKDGFPKDEDDNPLWDYTQSALDWRPVRANKIQFRPLCHELSVNDHGRVIPLMDGQGTGGSTVEGRSRKYNYVTGKMTQVGGAAQPECGFSKISRDRENSMVDAGDWRPSNKIYAENFSAGVDTTAFKADGTRRTDFDFNNHGIMYGRDYPYVGAIKYHKCNRFGDWTAGFAGWRLNMERVQGDESGFLTVGVIGSVCTVGAVQYVAFTTRNKIGSQSRFTGMAGQASATWLPTWGGTHANKYDQFGTTDLSVRIYQAHERENLIYDSRFFAVHHFNPGLGLADSIHHQANRRIPLFHGSNDFDNIFVDTDKDNHADCWVDVARTTVDHRTPSYVDFQEDCNIKESIEVGDGVPRRVPFSAKSQLALLGPSTWKDNGGDDIYSNAVEPQFGVYRRLISKEYWNVDPTRRGKLLPYNANRDVPQIPYFRFGENMPGFRVSFLTTNNVWARSEAMDNYDQLIGPIDKVLALETVSEEDGKVKLTPNPQNPEKVDVVLVNLGKDYKIGDKFKVDGFEKSEVTVMSTGNQGCINGLYFNVPCTNNTTFGDTPKKLSDLEKLGVDCNPDKLINLGINFVDPDDCDMTVDSVDEITSNTMGAAKFKPYNKFTVNGKGFSAFVTKATMKKMIITDHKPKIATLQDFAQLSMPADSSPGGSAGQSFLFGFIQGANNFIALTEGERIVQEDIDNPSPSGLYDCFFHFHNDTSHTIWNDNNMGPTHSVDQYIELEINPV